MSASPSDEIESGAPSLRVCVIAAAIIAGAIGFLWLKVVPVFEDVFNDFGRPTPAMEMLHWYRPISLGVLVLLCLWLFRARHRRAARGHWFFWAVLIGLILAATIIIAMFMPVWGPAEVVG